VQRLNFAVALVTSMAALAAGEGSAQDDTLPTLKLDRIPAQPAFAGQTRAPAAAPTRISVEVLTEELTAPWALAFLPGGDILINEYVGRMRVLGRDGGLSGPVQGLPEISTDGWAGLFDLALDPDFERSGILFFSYTAPAPVAGEPNVARVGRARFDRAAHRLVDVQVVVDGFGGQELLLTSDGRLFVAGAGAGVGSNGDPQDLGSTNGKLLRLTRDGDPAPGNPFVGRAGALAEIYSYGHRDISGIAVRPETGDLWMTEHGPRGGDELNRIVAGGNYGWKVISYGTEYNGDPVGIGVPVRAGMEQPSYFWWPSIAPSGLIFYSGAMFPEWRGNALVTALSGQHISRLVLDGDNVVAEERLLVDRAQRIRELREGPDGALYALTNEESVEARGNAQLLRISRAAPQDTQAEPAMAATRWSR